MTIKSKYNIGDKVYIISGNGFIETVIDEVEIKASSTVLDIKYTLNYEEPFYYYWNCKRRAIRKESEIWRSKEEFINQTQC